LPFLMSDTVGFIRKLPHHLVDSFKSTLDEVREADILIHVVDISHPTFEDQLETVQKTLAELGAGGKKQILVFNKIDAFSYTQKEEDDLTPSTRENISLEDFQKTWFGKENVQCIFISAKKKQNISQLKAILYKEIRAIHQERYPYHNFLY